MKKRWLKILGGVLLLILFVPVGLYMFALDWDRTHRSQVAALPFLTNDASDGEYQLKVGEEIFRLRVAGMANKGPNVLLLHGFPESSAIWVDLLKEAASEGYRVVAFDQRGYSPGARPSDTENYRLPLLVNDVFNVADQLGFDKFHLAGHDWGAVVGWFIAKDQNERLLSWSALSIPHAGEFLKGALHDPVQSRRSGYFKFLQRPIVPEFLMTMRNQKAIKDMFARVPENNRREYVQILAEPGALTAALNWYRAMDIEAIASDPARQSPVSVPTLFIWGKKDMVVAETVVESARRLMPEDYTEIAVDAGHALLQHVPNEVIPAMIAHWAAHSD